jgi:hypothetical protein
VKRVTVKRVTVKRVTVKRDRATCDRETVVSVKFCFQTIGSLVTILRSHKW